MSSVNQLLLWEKWRPKSIEDIVLLPRIRKHFEDGINGNYIFYGHYGTGKTSLARILIGKYSKDKPFLELNSSLFTSIDVLRTQIEDFCKYTPMMETESGIKYIFLDEFERVSAQFQDAFKAFIEKYNKNVRFIITTNHINKISDGIKSRIPQINFDCLDINEERFLKQEIFKRVKNVILPSENFSVSKEDLVAIITKKFPDFRSIMVELQNFISTGSLSNQYSSVSNKVKTELYEMLYDTSYDYERVWHFINNIFGPEKIDVLFKLLGKPFVDWSIETGKDIEKLFLCNYILSDYSSKLDSVADPIILAMTVVGKYRDTLL
jgi:DNA polymerase III delta prime subunit